MFTIILIVLFVIPFIGLMVLATVIPFLRNPEAETAEAVEELRCEKCDTPYLTVRVNTGSYEFPEWRDGEVCVKCAEVPALWDCIPERGE